jgi:glycosyltransferase involved in cell wall biosynthesis
MLGIIVYPVGTWEGFHRRPMLQALARNLYGKAVLIAVDPPVSLLDRHLVRDWRTRARAVLKPLVQWSDNLWLVRPARLSAGGLDWAAYARAIRRALRRISPAVSEVGALVFRPEQIDLLGLADEQHLIYECYDEYRVDHTGRVVEGVIERERHLMGASDLVLTTSRRLYESRRKEHGNVHHTPNGVSVELFRRAWDPSLGLPHDMVNLKRPIVGYVGNFTTWLDFGLLHHVIQALPRFSFVFVGPVTASEEARRLREFPNVRFLGPRPQHALPAYMRAMDVTICPLRVSEFTQNQMPLTVLEYLAAGRPVVTRRLDGMAALHDVLCTPAQPGEFAECIRQLSSSPNEAMRVRGLERAQEFDWDRLTQASADIILSTCERGRSSRRDGPSPGLWADER